MVAMQEFIIQLNSVLTTDKSDNLQYTLPMCVHPSNHPTKTQTFYMYVTNLVINAMFASIYHFLDKMQPEGDHRIKVGQTGAKIQSSTIQLFNNLKILTRKP
jgi:hypothetical protein